MARASITIVLELDLDQMVDSPVGSAHLPDGPSRTFHGWLGLAEAIDALAGMNARSRASSPARHLAMSPITNEESGRSPAREAGGPIERRPM